MFCIDCVTYLAVEDHLHRVRRSEEDTAAYPHSPFGRSTILLVEIIVFATGVKASFWRAQVTKSVD